VSNKGDKTGVKTAPNVSSIKTLEKSSKAFLTISEVSKELNLPQHVLRFWETKFASIKPMKRGGGRRYYRPKDVEFLKKISNLLYHDGYTIKGVQKLLKNSDIENSSIIVTKSNTQTIENPIGGKFEDLKSILKELKEIHNDLQKINN
tara:strand:+ start:229 stop:672 length:444 start_codon:yes stop_codon:yes gene_type:complete